MNNLLSLSAVCSLPDGSWVEDGFFAVVRAIANKQAGPRSKNPGKTFWVVTLADTIGPETAELAMFFAPKFRDGDVVEFTGRGIKHSVTNYGSKISIGQDTVITSVGQSAHAEEQRERAEALQPSVSGKPQRVDGQTVGMSMKVAVDLLSKDMSHDDLVARLISPVFWASVHEVSSDVIRVSRMLEAGRLAKPIKERCGSSQHIGASGDQPPPPSNVPPPAEKQAIWEEDVPF